MLKLSIKKDESLFLSINGKKLEMVIVADGSKNYTVIMVADKEINIVREHAKTRLDEIKSRGGENGKRENPRY